MKVDPMSLVDQQLVARYLALDPDHRRVVRDVVEGLTALNMQHAHTAKK